MKSSAAILMLYPSLLQYTVLPTLHFSGFSRHATADLCVAVATQTFIVKSKTVF
jgi:hypothetical protein